VGLQEDSKQNVRNKVIVNVFSMRKKLSRGIFNFELPHASELIMVVVVVFPNLRDLHSWFLKDSKSIS